MRAKRKSCGHLVRWNNAFQPPAEELGCEDCEEGEGELGELLTLTRDAGVHVRIPRSLRRSLEADFATFKDSLPSRGRKIGFTDFVILRLAKRV